MVHAPSRLWTLIPVATLVGGALFRGQRFGVDTATWTLFLAGAAVAVGPRMMLVIGRRGWALVWLLVALCAVAGDLHGVAMWTNLVVWPIVGWVTGLVLITRSAQAASRGDYDTAMRGARRFLWWSDDPTPITLIQTEQLVQQGELDLALDLAARLERDGRDANARAFGTLQRGTTLVELGRAADAIEALNTVLTGREDSVCALTARARARLMVGDADGARQDALAALEHADGQAMQAEQAALAAAVLIAALRASGRAGEAALATDRVSWEALAPFPRYRDAARALVNAT